MISITLPSIHEDACHRTLDNIRSTTRGAFQIVVVSPFEVIVDDHHVTWVRELEPRGCAYAHHVAARHAIGDFLVAFADDHEFVDGWDEVAVEEFKRRAVAFRSRVIRAEHGDLSAMSVGPFALGLRGAHSGHVGTNFGIYYPYFPMMCRADVHDVGWIDPDYRAGFGDSDLAMRVWSSGGRCEWSEAGLLRPMPSDKRKEASDDRRPAAAYTDADLALFIRRWASRYAPGWPIVGIDSFNIDVRSEENMHLVDGNTICENSLAFMSRVVRMTT
jgi:hypothetical protein